MATINPYLNFMGQTEEAFKFYQSVFGGELRAIQRFKDTAQGKSLSAEDQEKIMHIALPIGNGNILMGTDVLSSMGHDLTLGNNFSLSINTASVEEADRIFAKLSSGGLVRIPMERAFWGDYFGMLTDKFGIQWMISYAAEQQNSVGEFNKENIIA